MIIISVKRVFGIAAVSSVLWLLLIPFKADAYSGSATAYHVCDGSTSLQANGTRAKFGEVANNYLRLGTWIKMVYPKKIHGRRFFRVDDRGGSGFALDFYAPSCGWMNWWGRRYVKFKKANKVELKEIREYNSRRGGF